MNAPWHKKNVLGSNAPLAKRINWHLAHLENCGCRAIPKSISALLKGKRIKICNRGHCYIDNSFCPVCWPGGFRKKKR